MLVVIFYNTFFFFTDLWDMPYSSTVKQSAVTHKGSREVYTLKCTDSVHTMSHPEPVSTLVIRGILVIQMTRTGVETVKMNLLMENQMMRL